MDDGVGMNIPFDPDTADTLGLQLVSDLTHQMQGEISTRWNGGADIAITFKTTSR